MKEKSVLVSLMSSVTTWIVFVSYVGLLCSKNIVLVGTSDIELETAVT